MASAATVAPPDRGAPSRAEDRFRLLVDGIKDFAIFMMDVDGKVETWSAGAERLDGYKADEILGVDFARLHTPEDIQAAKPRRALAIAEKVGRYEEETWRVRKDGSRFWANVVITPLRDPSGRLVGYGNVTRDVTERLRATEQFRREHDRLVGQLRTVNVELEQRVKERTAQLAATLEEREVLLQEVHHRVKNNLQVISSLIGMQVRALGGDASRRALEECQMRVQAIALIHEKLYQSRDYAHVPFSEYARSLAGSVFRATGVSPEGISLELAIEDVALPVDKAVPCSLILNELITNALKHAFRGSRAGTIRVELKNVEGALRLAVSDDGAGLPVGLDVRKSPSLGLDLVRMLAKQLDTTLEVDGTAGTCFSLTVPLER